MEKNIPKSTLWFNLRKLRDSGIVRFNSRLTLTKLGKLLSNNPRVAQLVERSAVTRQVAGANLASRTSRKAGGKQK